MTLGISNALSEIGIFKLNFKFSIIWNSKKNLKYLHGL